MIEARGMETVARARGWRDVAGRLPTVVVACAVAASWLLVTRLVERWPLVRMVQHVVGELRVLHLHGRAPWEMAEDVRADAALVCCLAIVSIVHLVATARVLRRGAPGSVHAPELGAFAAPSLVLASLAFLVVAAFGPSSAARAAAAGHRGSLVFVGTAACIGALAAAASGAVALAWLLARATSSRETASTSRKALAGYVACAVSVVGAHVVTRRAGRAELLAIFVLVALAVWPRARRAALPSAALVASASFDVAGGLDRIAQIVLGAADAAQPARMLDAAVAIERTTALLVVPQLLVAWLLLATSRAPQSSPKRRWGAVLALAFPLLLVGGSARWISRALRAPLLEYEPWRSALPVVPFESYGRVHPTRPRLVLDAGGHVTGSSSSVSGASVDVVADAQAPARAVLRRLEPGVTHALVVRAPTTSRGWRGLGGADAGGLAFRVGPAPPAVGVLVAHARVAPRATVGELATALVTASASALEHAQLGPHAVSVVVEIGSTDEEPTEATANVAPLRARAHAPTASGGCSASRGARGASGRQTIDVDRRARSVLVEVPESSAPAPLIVAFHGNGDSGDGLREQLGMERRARDAIVAYPDALGGRWDTDHAPPDNGDFRFVDALVAHIARTSCVDVERVYLVGFSRGGYFASQLACRAERAYAGLLVYSGGAAYGSDLEDTDGIARCVSPTPAIFVHGLTDDAVVPAEGRAGRDLWRATNGCFGTPERDGPEPCVAWSSCASGAPVAWCAVSGLGHEPWAGLRDPSPWHFSWAR